MSLLMTDPTDTAKSKLALMNLGFILTGILAHIGAWKLGGVWGVAVYWGLTGHISYEFLKLKKFL